MLNKSFGFVSTGYMMDVSTLQNRYFIFCLNGWIFVWSAPAAAATSTISFLCPANFLWQGNSWIYGGRVKGSLSSETESGQTLYSSSSFCSRGCVWGQFPRAIVAFSSPYFPLWRYAGTRLSLEHQWRNVFVITVMEILCGVEINDTRPNSFILLYARPHFSAE